MFYKSTQSYLSERGQDNMLLSLNPKQEGKANCVMVDPRTSDRTTFNFQLASKLGKQFDYLGFPKQLAGFASAK